MAFAAKTWEGEVVAWGDARYGGDIDSVQEQLTNVKSISSTYAAFAAKTPGAEEPLALIRQDEYLDEPEPGRFVHVREVLVAEWPVQFLRRPRRTARTIPDFLSPDAPANRLDILRGLAKP